MERLGSNRFEKAPPRSTCLGTKYTDLPSPISNVPQASTVQPHYSAVAVAEKAYPEDDLSSGTPS